MLSRFSSSMELWDVLDLPISFNAEKDFYKFVWDSDDKFALDGLMS